MTTRIERSLRLIDPHAAVRPDMEMPGREPITSRTTFRQDAMGAVAKYSGTSTEPDLFNILILNYTMQCPLACDYCCYGCSPKRHETMDRALALDLVDQAAELGVFAQCGFTGGEALIQYDDIMAITERMQRRRLPFSMISSCYWATDAPEARRVIGDLAQRGMAVFTATHDPSHENWVPIAYVRSAVEAALERNVHVCICASFYDDTKRLESIFPEFVGHPEVDYVNRVVLPDVGFAKRKSISPASYPNVNKTVGYGGCYKRIYHDVTVFWDGEVYPCCSVYNRTTPGITLGNVYHDSLATIWERLEGSLLIRTLKGGGFAELYDIVRRLDPNLARDLPTPSDAVGGCHLCNMLLGNGDLTRRLMSVVAIYERERIQALLASVRRAHGDETERRVVLDALAAGGAVANDNPV